MSYTLDLVLRPLEQDRIDDVRAIDMLCFRDYYPHDRWVTIANRERLSTVIAIDESQDTVLAFIVFDIMRTGSILVERFAVHPSSWRRGIGWRLMQTVEQIAKNRNGKKVLVPFTFDEMLGVDDCERLNSFLYRMKYEPATSHHSLIIFEKELNDESTS